jgi:hypothetical protein
MKLISRFLIFFLAAGFLCLTTSCLSGNTEKMNNYAQKLKTSSADPNNEVVAYNKIISEFKPVVLVFNYRGAG